MTWQVFERGWLSSNNILFVGQTQTCIVDTGYCTHADQTLALVRTTLANRCLDRIVNTHLHSDHCGGNARLQQAYPNVQTFIAATQSDPVREWDIEALAYEAIGQHCERFSFYGTLTAGQEIVLGDSAWQIHASPGHDPHSVILFEPITKTLISADALWQNGFGVVFQETGAEDGFTQAAATLALIERLAPQTVIPGHGAVFSGAAVQQALATAYQRLNAFIKDPKKHTRYTIKVLLKYKLLELQKVSLTGFLAWAMATPFFLEMYQSAVSNRTAERSQVLTPVKEAEQTTVQAKVPSASAQASSASVAMSEWLQAYIDELVASGAARREGDYLINQ